MSLDPPVATDPTEVERLNRELLDEILDNAAPLLREGILLAAIPHSYDVALMRAIRPRDDGREEGLLARLERFSFVRPVERGGETRYAVHASEREWLNLRWIIEGSSDYVAAHRRAAEFWHERADHDDHRDIEALVYHLLLASGREGPLVDRRGVTLLEAEFREHVRLRQLPALEMLLNVAEEAHRYLVALGAAETAALGDMLRFMRLRLAQLRGQYEEGTQELAALRAKPTLHPELRPYVERAHGLAQLREGNYVAAIDAFRDAQRQLAALPPRDAEHARTLEVEQGLTELMHGDAYVALAVAARGYRETLPRPPEEGLAARFDWLRALPDLPLLVYLGFQGFDLTDPGLWSAVRGQDWIIARLFGRAAYHYRHADERLEALPQRELWDRADERLANIDLLMGNAGSAVPRLEALLERQRGAGGDPYTLATLELGIAQGLLREGDHVRARELLDGAIPIFRRFEDPESLTLALGLQGEARVREGQIDEAIGLLARAMRRYVRLGNPVAATDIAERLEEIGAGDEVSPEQRERIAEQVATLPERHYPARFRHRYYQLFERVVLLMASLMLFLVPMRLIRLGASNYLGFEVGFQTTVPLDPSFGIDPLQASPSFDGSGLVPSFESDLAITVALVLIVGYFLLYILVGLFLLFRTRLSSVEAAVQQRILRISPEGVALGAGEGGSELPLERVTHLVRRDVALWREPVPNYSRTVLAGEEARVTVAGETAWYAPVARRLEGIENEGLRRLQLGYSMLRGRMGALYLLGLALIALFALGSTSSVVLNQRWLGTSYTIVDVYPYLFLLIFLPPFWWGVIRPLMARARLGEHRLAVTLTLVAGLALALLRGATLPLLDWFIFPDIYPSLTVALLLGAALAALWIGRRPQVPGATATGIDRRLGVLALIGVVVMLLALAQVASEVWAYNHLVRGNHLISAAAREGDAPVACRVELLGRAVDAYGRAIRIAPRSLPARRGRAAALTQLAGIASEGRPESTERCDPPARYTESPGTLYALAVEDAAAAAGLAGDELPVLADAAVVHSSYSTFLHEHTDEDQLAVEEFNRALTLLDRALEQAETTDERAEMLLWKGIVFQSSGALNDAAEIYASVPPASRVAGEALKSQGWVFYAIGNQWFDAPDSVATLRSAERNYLAALEAFDAARMRRGRDGGEIGLDLARGYTYYQLGETRLGLSFQDDLSEAEREVARQNAILSWATAHQIWGEAQAQSTLNHDIWFSLSTAKWRLGTVGVIRCADSRLSDEERAEALRWIEGAISDITQAIALEPENAFDYRTRAQYHFIRGRCPGIDRIASLEAGRDDYAAATRFEPENAKYWQLLARFETALYTLVVRDQSQLGEARALLAEAREHIDRSFDLDPNDATTVQWRSECNSNCSLYIRPLAFQRGRADLELGAFASALDNFLWVDKVLPPEIRGSLIAFDIAFAYFRLDETDAAAGWYNEALARQSRGPGDSFDLALTRLRALIADAPTAEGVAAARLAESREQMTRDLPALLEAQPDLQSSAAFWDHHARFHYEVGRILFDVGLEREARAAYLASVEGARRAASLSGESYAAIVDWGWGGYYLRRGDRFYEEGDYLAARDDYITAAELIVPVGEASERARVEALLGAGLSALARVETGPAEQLVTLALRIIESPTYTEDFDAPISLALVRLTALAEAGVPDTERFVEAIEGVRE